jgi:hypothetical protein
MDYDNLRLLCVLLCGLCLAQTVWIIVLQSNLEEARQNALFIAQALEDVARGKVEAFMHMGQVHISEAKGE